jgi:KDO2-lipid IV(A) lauroyltransferase
MQTMAKRRRLAVDFAVFCVLRLVAAVLQALPLSVGYAVARRLAQVVAFVDCRHRAIAEENLQCAFGDALTPDQRRRMTLRVYEHFCKVVVEILHLPRRFRTATMKRFVNYSNMGTGLRACLREDRPAIIVAGHLGNWEVSGVMLAAADLRSFTIARTLDNPFLNRFLLDFRQYTGQTILSKNDDYEKICDALANRRLLVTVADQSAGPRGYFVDFFGRPASTQRAVALLAFEYDAPVVVTYSHRVGEGFQYEVGAEAVFDPRDYQDDPNGARRLTADFTAALERSIRRAPEQYFWLHNRWKHQPPVRKQRAAA